MSLFDRIRLASLSSPLPVRLQFSFLAVAAFCLPLGGSVLDDVAF